MPADQTQVGQAWTGGPQPEQLRADRAPAQRGSTERQRAVLPSNGPAAAVNRQAFDFSASPDYAGPQAPGHAGPQAPSYGEPQNQGYRGPQDQAYGGPQAAGDGRGVRSERAELPEPEHQAGPRRRWVAVGLTLAALVLAGWSATSFIDSAAFPVAALAALAPLVSVLALPVIAIGVASKHLVPTAIAVIAALLPWTLVTGYAAASPGVSTAKSSTLRVMSVDGAEGRASAKDIVQVTRLYAVDVVVVTDLSSTQAHDLTVAGLNALAPSRWVNVTAGGVNGTGLWARPNIENPTATTGLSRVGVDGLIAAGTTKIGITVVHLAGDPLRPGSGWRSDLTALATRTPPATESFIVGDLNAGPWQPAFRRLTSSKWRDSADVIGQGLRPTWPSWSPLPIAPTDHVLVSKGIGVGGAETTNIAGSSHRALIVTLNLPTGGD
jgi:endonuclease/exonuclease/phosphatase (EEP) superfamily protein YafD